MARFYGMLGLAAFAGALAQTPPPTDYVLRFDVDLLQVDAVVSDSHGNHVASLTPENFEVFQDSKPQKITHFSYIAAKTSAEQPGAATGGHSLPVRAPTRNEVGRTIVFLLDDAKMDFADFRYAVVAMRRSIQSELKANDIAAIFRTSYGSGAMQTFTNDAGWLEKTLDRITWYPPLTTAHYSPLLTELPAIIRALASYPGRKSILLISPGEPPTDDLDIARGVADAANRASVTIETIDARGLPTLDSIQAENAHPRGSLNNRSIAYFQSQSLLEFLAQMTAGRFQHDNNDITGQVRDGLHDADGYYLLGWYPGSEAFRSGPNGAATYHHIQIRLRGVKGLSLRTRDGFYSSPGANARVAYSPSQEMNEALFSPFRSGDIDVHLTAALGYDEGDGAYIESQLHILSSGLDFHDVPGQPGCKLLDLEILSTPEPLDFDKVQKGEVEGAHTQITVCRSEDGLLDELLRHGLVVVVRNPIAVPGGYLMQVAVRNMEAGDTPSIGEDGLIRRPSMTPEHIRVGSANQLIEVPDTRKDDLVLTGIKLQSGDFEEPTANDKTFYRIASPNDPAVRQFHPGDTLNFSLRLLRAEKKSAEPAEVRIRFLRDGKEIYSAAPLSAKPGEPVTGTYRLDSSAEPGHYLMEAAAGAVTQWIDFEIGEK